MMDEAGNLGQEQSRYEVRYARTRAGVILEGSHVYLFFQPREALSILDWLYREKETLERLAKEQERE